MTARRRPAWDPHPPLWVTHPELRPLAQHLAAAQRWPLAALERSDPLGVPDARGVIEDQVRAVLAAGWYPPTAPADTVSTVDELEALPPGTVVTDPDGHPWIRNRVGEWCEPCPAGIDPADLLADGPVTIRHTPTDHDPSTTAVVSGTVGFRP